MLYDIALFCFLIYIVEEIIREVNETQVDTNGSVGVLVNYQKFYFSFVVVYICFLTDGRLSSLYDALCYLVIFVLYIMVNSLQHNILVAFKICVGTHKSENLYRESNINGLWVF